MLEHLLSGTRSFQFPILRSAMAFNNTLTKAIQAQINKKSKAVDVLQVHVSPFLASFESWLNRGLILEVVMQERMLVAHVRSVLKHLRRGYCQTP